MKIIILASFIIIKLISSNFYNLKPISITKDIHCVIGDFHPPMKSNKGFVSNMCYIDIGDSLVALDAGPTYSFAKEFHQKIKEMYPNKKVSYVIISNFHDDRLQGASYFKEIGAKIVGHISINDDIVKYKNKFERMEKITSKKVYKNTKIVKIDTLVKHGYTIKGSKKSLKILKYSKVSEERSDISIYSKNDSFLFVGNIVFNGRMLNYRNESDVDGWIHTLEKLALLNAKYLLGGHGKEYDSNSYKPSLEYLKILKRDVTKAYNEDMDVEDTKEFVNSKKFNYLNHFNALNNRNIVHYYNQLEWQE